MNKVSGPLPPPAPPLRPRELEDWLNYHLYHVLAWRLALLLARTPATPNMVSVAGSACIVAAGIAYAQPWWPFSALLGMALHMAWHVVDGADGDLARLTGRVSPIGEMVDGISDYVGHIVLYVILAWLLAAHWPVGFARGGGPTHPALAWLLALAAGVSHVLQTNHAEVQRRSYQWWVYGKPWLRTTHAAVGAATRAHVFGGIAAFYLTIAAAMSRGARAVDAAVARAGDDRARLEVIRAAVRLRAPALLRLAAAVGPNPRAILLGLSMLAGSPLYYFLTVIVGMNALLAWSVRRHDQAARAIVAGLGATPAP